MEKSTKVIHKTSSKELKAHQNSEFASQANMTVSPADFDEFLVWACNLFNIDISLSKKAQMVSETTKAKKGKSRLVTISDEEKEVKSINSSMELDMEKEELKVYMLTTYLGNDLVQILIEKTKHIPRELFALLACVVEFHPRLQRITVNSGLDQYTVYELCKIINCSCITEVFLDNNFIKQANYDILLEKLNHLQVLSLARCKIGDQCVKNIAEKLHYPLPASTTLLVLNLSTNRLTDLSCKYIAEALRTNRKLTYINLADNMITDKGGKTILRVLLQFSLTVKEILAFKQRYTKFLKEKQYFIEKYKYTHKSGTGLKKNKPTKVERTTALVLKKGESFPASEYDKALEMATKIMGEFVDPMTDCTYINGLRHCNGNNTLVYLNFSYNNLSYMFLKLLTKVLQYQYSSQRPAKGLINVRLEGNPLPTDCVEYTSIDAFFDMGVTIIAKKPSAIKKSTKPNK